MKHDFTHVDDEQLQQLLLADEDSTEYRSAAAHVETCESCQQRLGDFAGPATIDATARQMLSGYPWDDLTTCRFGDMRIEREPNRDAKFDFLSPPGHPEMLGRLGRYEIEREIGSGGMGIVLKAFDTDLNRPVAVKVLARHLAHNGAARQRFAREARAAAAVVHEHVVAIHNVEAESNTPFLVMQYVAGESLQTRVDRCGPLDAKEILRIGIQTAGGLAAAHEQGVIHRDIKPANILLENGVERVLLTDFGLARTVDDASLTHTGVVAGTPHYMSPEQSNGLETDHRTDLFSLGSVLYFMATGHPPFRAERAMGILHCICHERQCPLWQAGNDVPDELSVIVDRLLEKRVVKRFDSAHAVREQLTSLLADIQQPRSGFVRRFKRLKLRYPGRTLTATTLVLVSTVAAIWAACSPPGAANSSPDTDSVKEQVVEDEVSLASRGFSLQEFGEFEATMAELNSRLDTLGDSGVFFAPDTHDHDSALQSVQQRLDRLQSDELPESQNHETKEH